jgi:4-hydroxy-3-methylbut-2-en-1-yl diphosphate synthase IspG/GcpE
MTTLSHACRFGLNVRSSLARVVEPWIMKVESHWSVMKKIVVKKMEVTFRECPQCFFSEHDIHSLLYRLTTEELKHHGINSNY